MTNIDTDARFLQYQASKIVLPEIEIEPEKTPIQDMTPMEMMVESTKAMPQAYQTAVPEAISGGAKGAITGVVGIPGEALGLISGLLNAISPKDYKGQPHNPDSSILERFVQGYEIVPGKMEDVDEWLTEKGWEVGEIGEPIKDLMEFIAPAGVTKSTVSKTVKKIKGMVNGK